VCSITDNNALNLKQKQDYLEFGFKSHLDFQSENTKTKLKDYSIVGTSTQSLPKLKDKKYDIIIIDEFQSVFDGFINGIYDVYLVYSIHLIYEIFSIIKKQHIINPDDERAIGNFDLAAQFSKVTGLFSILTFVGFFVGTLVLLSGAIGISNIMLIVVKERTKEIGIRRALGATPWGVRMQILQESLTLTILSGMAGVSFAAGVIWLINFLLERIGPVENFANPSVDIKVILIALLILIFFGVLAGLIPAIRATKMKPIDALRTE
jgi:ABC-type antimicrobial peptide transport system permease subunit